MVGCLAGLSLLASGMAEGLTPPEPPKAEIYFSNGGRIITMNADGSGRTELTRAGSVTTRNPFGQDGDSDPSLSPDGARMVFIRSTKGTSDEDKDQIILAGSDGSNPKPILTKLNTQWLDESPSWTPDGKSLVMTKGTWKGHNRWVSSVVSVKPNGTGGKTIYSLKPHNDGPPKYIRLELLNPKISPDGTRLLVTVSDAYTDDSTRLAVIDIKSGKRKVLGLGTRSGNWSPDGSSIVYVSTKGSRSEYCQALHDSCLASGDLFTADADGKNPHRLTRTRSNEDDPSWSPAGDRILYTSNRAVPSSLEASEVFSMSVDGNCRVPLTNGAPGSFSPVWNPDGNSGLPEDLCSHGPPPVLTEVMPETPARYGSSYWPGPNVDGQLVTTSDVFFGFDLEYDDCDLALIPTCGKPMTVMSFPICFWEGLTSSIYGNKGADFSLRRGAGVDLESEKHVTGLTMTAGKSLSWIVGFGKSDPKDILKFVDSMRPVGQIEPMNGDLPAPRVPARDARILRIVERTVEKTGSVAKAAKALDKKKSSIRRNLRFGKQIRKLGPIQTVNCPKDSRGPFADDPSASGSSTRTLEIGSVGSMDVRGIDRRKMLELVRTGTETG